MKLNVSLKPNALLAELVGTFILATVAVTVANPIIVGFTLLVLVLALGAISGAHVNPAVTFGLWSVRKLEGVKVPFYWAMQFAGALLALLVIQYFKGGDFGISFASFNSLDGKILIAELLGVAVFTFAIAAAVEKGLADAAKSLCIGLALLTGLAVSGGLLGQAVQTPTLEGSAAKAARISKVDGGLLNPAIALVATERDAQTASLQGLASEQAGAEKARPASRLTWETLIGGLVGAAIGMNLYMVTAGVNPHKKKKTVAEKVTSAAKAAKKKVVKKAKK